MTGELVYRGLRAPRGSPQGAGVCDTCSPQDRKMGLLVAKASMGDPARGQMGVFAVRSPQARFPNWIPGAPPSPGPPEAESVGWGLGV